MDESQQDVLSSDVVVVQHASLFLRQHHDAPGSVGKPLKHDDCSLVLGAGLALLFGTSTDVFHSSRPDPQVPCCTFVARPVVSQPACLVLRPIEASAVSDYNSQPTVGYSPALVTFCDVAWMSAVERSTRPAACRDLGTGHSERPGRNMFAQGATMTAIVSRW